MTASTVPDILNQILATDLSVLIIGSGIGGLTAARECLRRGFTVRIFERQPEAVLTGDSFTIGPSALRSLRNYPSLERAVNSIGTQPRMIVHRLDGTVMRGPLDFTDFISASVDRETAKRVLRLSRPKLYRAMLDHLGRLGVEVEFGVEVVDYFEEIGSDGLPKAGVVLRDGSRHEADVVIAADGVSGRSWKIVTGYEAKARPSGDAIFRVSYPIEQALKDPVVAEKFINHRQDDQRPLVSMYMGDIQIYASTYKDTVEWALVHKDDGRAQESWDHHPSLESVYSLLSSFPELPPEIYRLVATAPSERLLDWRIMWRDPQPQWSSAGGHIIQLGDAAHTFHPSSGNGATQAMEDAVSLATCLAIAAEQGKHQVPWATRVHNLLRFDRVSCLQAFGIANQAERVKSGGLPSIGRWIVNHDPEAYALDMYEKAREHFRSEAEFANTNIPPGMVYQEWTIETLLKDEEGKGELPAVLQGDWS